MYYIRNRFGLYLKDFDGSLVSFTSFPYDSRGFVSYNSVARFLSKLSDRYIIQNRLHVVYY